jgi:hypothetical protein
MRCIVLTAPAYQRQFNDQSPGVRRMSIANIGEEMDLFASSKQADAQAMHWCISPAFVEKATQFVQILEILRIGLTPPKVQARNLKIRPKVAQVVWILQVRKLILATDFRRVNIGIFNEEPQGGVWMEIGGI